MTCLADFPWRSAFLLLINSLLVDPLPDGC